MSLLTIVQDSCAELSLVQPTQVLSSSDLQVQLLLRLAGKEGKELARRFDWQRLVKEGTFVTVASSTQVADLPVTFANFARIVNNSMFNRTTKFRVFGPLSSLEWQARQASGLNANINNFFRIRGNSILFYPTPTAGDSIYFEYISKNWCINEAGNTEQSLWVNDSDTALIDEEVVTLGVIWRFLKAKGLDYGEEFATYERALEQIFGPDGGRDMVDLTGEMVDWFSAHITEGDWPTA